jgi:outer membrane protein OmpA-like peptidoglycan-associated protein
MASKKYTLLTGVFCLLVTLAFSQVRPYEDSSVIPSKRMPQYTEFKAGTYDFPAKPRNQWEVGIKVGAFNVAGDVVSRFPTPGFGIHVRKAWGYLFSTRLEYMYGTGKGLNWQSSSGYRGKTGNPWNDLGYTSNVFYNYKTKVQELSLQGVFALNNIRFHKAKTGVSFYAFAGIGGMVYDTKVNALDGSGARYNFSGITSATHENRKNTLDALKNLLDDSYETDAESEAGKRRAKLFGETFRTVFNFGGGVAYKLNNRFNIALEDKFTATNDDLIDGQRWAEQPAPGSAVLTQNFDTYNFLSLGLNYNIGAKSVEPLWWQNPLEYVYAEVRNPKLMRIPPPVLPDQDGDGVTDQFDLEPNTPQGCPVDSHGVSKDTDGDGVPDCKDKELVTPTYCQPVDADGVGKCPVPCPDTSCACCQGRVMGNNCDQALAGLPSVTFSENSVKLSNDAKSILASAAARIRTNPECKVVVVGYCASTKQQQQRSWDRVNAVINYLVEQQGISQDRLIFLFGQEGGDCNTVDLRAAAAGEESLPSTVPAPHPNLKRTK